jgi:hypothetical protein
MASTALPTFEVDKEGLRKLLDRKGKSFVLTELISNAWDEEGVTNVEVSIFGGKGASSTRRGTYTFLVDDDSPEGFKNLRHAYTLFAESEKKGNVAQRGRFNLGEKLVIAACERCEIVTTKGTVSFMDDHRVESTSTLACKARGSSFYGVIKMTRAEHDECVETIRSLIVPTGVTLTLHADGDIIDIEHRKPIAVFHTSLMTEWADADGVLHRNPRDTKVEVHQPLWDERATIYELGIPVVETGDEWHVNVQQKVPLNMDRDGVTPSYLKAVRAEVLNRMADQPLGDHAGDNWVSEALTSDRVRAHAVGAVLDARFGEKRVGYDPSDPEANKRAVAAGYAVVYPRSLPTGVAPRARELGLLRPAGQVTPSPRPYHEDGGDVRATLAPEQWSSEIRNIAEYANGVAQRLLGKSIQVEIVNDARCRNFGATYGGSTLELNLRVLGRSWFANGPTDEVNALLIHEFAHNKVSDHLSDAFYRECCRLGAKLARTALDEPEFFASHEAVSV